jgi:hypothetical protein
MGGLTLDLIDPWLEIAKYIPPKINANPSKLKILKFSEKSIQARIATITGLSNKSKEINPEEKVFRLYTISP